MKILVTGSAGRLGRSVHAELKNRGHDVFGVDVRRGSGPCDFEVDLIDAGEAYGSVARVRPEAVVHLAGLPTPFGRSEHVLFATNTLTTFHVCQAAADLGVRSVLCASSPTVIGYGNPNGWVPSYLPLDEKHPTRAWHGYGISKLAIEAMIQGFAAKAGPTKYFTFRPCYVVAPEEWEPGMPTQLGHSIAERLKRPEFAAGSLFNYIDARDAATLVAMICESADKIANGECFFASADDALATEALCNLLPKFAPSTAPFASELTGARPAFSNAKAHRLLGWKPLRSWRQFVELGE